jgi:putative ABC transport system permease protein
MNSYITSILIGIRTGIREMRLNLFRSVLTLLGVLLGVSSIMIMLSIFKGMDNTLQEMFTLFLGGESKIMITDKTWDLNVQARARIMNAPTLSLDDAKNLEDNLDFITAIHPMQNYREPIFAGNKKHQSNVLAVKSGYLELFNNFVERGRSIREEDNQRCRLVIVLGAKTAEELFGRDGDPLGKTVVFKGLPFTVIGVLHKYVKFGGDRSQNFWDYKNSFAFFPFSVAREKLMDKNRSVTGLEIFTDGDHKKIGYYMNTITKTLKYLHGGVENFKVTTMYEQYERISRDKNSFAFMFIAIAVISLLVGGVSIFNIMLASINSRFHEIGIRKAIGATGTDIFIQFLTEAVLLSLAGVVFGTVFSRLILQIITPMLMQSIRSMPEMTVQIVSIGVYMGVIVGIVSGLYPALRASRFDPVKALGYGWV